MYFIEMHPRAVAVVALLLLVSAGSAAPSPPSDTAPSPATASCSHMVNDYLHMSSSGPSRRYGLLVALRQAVAAESEARRCHEHPPSTPEEIEIFNSGSEAYGAHCQVLLQRAADGLHVARHALEAHDKATHQLATDVFEQCVADAKREATAMTASADGALPLMKAVMLHVVFLRETFVAVMRYFAVDVYWATSGQHFLSFTERYAKEAYALYLSFSTGKPVRYDMLLPGTQKGLNPPSNDSKDTQSGFMRTLTILAQALRKAVFSDTLVIWIQFLGCLVAPAFVLTALSSVVVLLLPVIAAYFLWYEFAVQFMFRGMLLYSGILSPVTSGLTGDHRWTVATTVEAAVWLAGEYPWECVGYLTALLVLARVSLWLSRPWRHGLLAFLPR